MTVTNPWALAEAVVDLLRRGATADADVAGLLLPADVGRDDLAPVHDGAPEDLDALCDEVASARLRRGGEDLRAVEAEARARGFDWGVATWSVESIEVKRRGGLELADVWVAARDLERPLRLHLDDATRTARGWHLVFLSARWEASRLVHRLPAPPLEPDPFPPEVAPVPAPAGDVLTEPLVARAAAALREAGDDLDAAGEAVEEVLRGLGALVDEAPERAQRVAWAIAGLLPDALVGLTGQLLRFAARVGRPPEAAAALRALGSLALRAGQAERARGYVAAARHFDPRPGDPPLALRAQAYGVLRAIEVAADSLHLEDALARQLEVPPAWFEAHFPPAGAGFVAAVYRALYAPALRDEVLRDVANALEDRGGVEAATAERALGPDDPNATGVQRSLLRAMSTPAPLVNLAVGGMHYPGWVEVDGTLRWLGKMRLGLDGDALYPLACAGHAAGFAPGGLEGEALVAAWAEHVAARARAAGELPS